jgi:hypothetical protein
LGLHAQFRIIRQGILVITIELGLRALLNQAFWLVKWLDQAKLEY